MSGTRLADQRVLVTGGFGFIGSALCRRLADEGAEVTRLSRTSHPGNDSVRCDLADAGQVDQVFARVRPDVVFHLASHVVGSRSIDVVRSTFESNLTSTLNLLMAAREARCSRVILTGSLEEPEPGPDWPVPSSPYAAAKMGAAAYGRMFHALFELPVTILRLFMVYGPGQRDTRKLVPYVITSLLKQERPRLSSGARPIDWIYIDDVVEAYLSAALAPAAKGATIDVGSGSLTSVAEIVKRIHDIIGVPEAPSFGDQAERPMEQIRVADTTTAARLLDWAPRAGLDDGLSRTVDFYRETLERDLDAGR